MGTRLAALVFFVLAAFVLAGCGGGDDVVSVAEWKLAIDGKAGERAVTPPVHLDDDLPRAPSRYVLRTEVALPDAFRGKDLSLAIPFFAGLATLRANGVPAEDLDPSSVQRYRSATGAHVWRVPAAATVTGAVALEMTVEHRWTASAWLDTVPRLSATPDGDARFEVVALLDEWGAAAAVIATSLLAAAYAALAMAGDAKRRSTNAWMLLQSLGAASYPAFMLGITQVVAGTRDLAVVAIAFGLTCVANVRFTYAQFKLGRMPRAWWVALAVVAAVGAAMSGPFQAMRVVIPLIVALVFATVIHNLILLVRALRRRPLPVSTVLMTSGWSASMFLTYGDVSFMLGRGEPFGGFHTATIAIAITSLLQVLALARDHAASLREADALNVSLAARVEELEATNREVRSLNEELRRQIAARSEQLSQALARGEGVQAASRTLEAGTVIDDRYRVERALGAGGMGEVHVVTRVRDGRRLALKVLHGFAGPQALARFAREAQIASQIDHPNIVGVVDVDVSKSGFLFIVMEYVDGASLDGMSARYGDAAWALPILRQVAEGLAAIHAKSIVHRDLKPANVLLANATSGPPVAKIADFGISSLAPDVGDTLSVLAETVDVSRAAEESNGSGAKLTQAGAILGTPLYMAPELARGVSHARPSADVFSFGVITFELLSGKLPFTVSPALEKLRGRSAPPAPSFRTILPWLSADDVDLFDRCLSSVPAKRPPAEEMARCIERLAAAKPSPGEARHPG